jgi:hypothetical protein
MLGTTSTTPTTSTTLGGWWQTTWGKVLGGLDNVASEWVDNWSGQNNTVDDWSGWYPEATPPAETDPVEEVPDFWKLGNNPQSYALLVVLAVAGYVAYKAVK